MKKFRRKILVILFVLSFFSLSFADDFKVTIAGYSISIEGDKSEKVWKILESFPLKEEKDIFEIVKNIDKNFVVEKQFTFSFNVKDNVLTIVEPTLEWGKLHLEIKVVPYLINDVIVEFNVEETPKWWEEKMKKMMREKEIPQEVIEKNEEKTKEEILKRAKEENWTQERLQNVLKQMEDKYNLLRGKMKPKLQLKGGRMQFKLGKIGVMYCNRLGKDIKEGKMVTFTEFRTIVIERE